jgi:hypothetical protein
MTVESQGYVVKPDMTVLYLMIYRLDTLCQYWLVTLTLGLRKTTMEREETK